MGFDLFLPSLRLAFEYHGEQHFRDTMIFGLSEMYATRDAEKRAACLASNVTLIEIPYWWDDHIESLKTTIHHARPDLIKKPGSLPAIPKTNPANSSQSL